MKFTIYQESRPGARPNNQDRVAYSYTRESLLLVVADGMGGHLHGEIAAQIAVQYIIESFQRAAKPMIQDELMFLSRSLSNAHAAIQDYAFDKSLPEAPRTTVVACLIQNSVAFWAHAGDSRLYLIRRGRIVQQTKDHSRLQMMLDRLHPIFAPGKDAVLSKISYVRAAARWLRPRHHPSRGAPHD